MPKTPSYRKRRNCQQGLVTLTDAVTGERRDYYLGEYNSPDSRELYHRLVAEWESAGRRLPRTAPGAGGLPVGPTVLEVAERYWSWAEQYYRPQHAGAVKTTLALLKRYYGHSPAEEFGPNKLRLLREEMIRGDHSAKPPRPPSCRKYINDQAKRIRHMFKWAVAHELVPASVHQALCTLEPLKRGRSSAKENGKVGPVPQHLFEATLKHLSGPVRALVELQRLTGARPGELLGIRRCDLRVDEANGIWSYQPQEHKNAFREHERTIYFGPRAQEILQPFLKDRVTTAYLFSPAEAEAKRRERLTTSRETPLSCGNRVGSNRKATPRRQPHDRYTTVTYYRAIQYACQKAFPLPKELRRLKGESMKEWRERMEPEGWDQVKSWWREHSWHPHQLRHSAATELRRAFGLEAAQLTLGHASAQITDAVYAERDQAKVIEIMRKIG